MYNPQLFLHSVFGYRGIVLFPWHARLYDRDVSPAAAAAAAAADRYVVKCFLVLYLIKWFSLLQLNGPVCCVLFQQARFHRPWV